MKYILLTLLAGASFSAAAQQHQLEKLWSTDSIVAIPESVYPDFKGGILYVSLIDGSGWGVDGKGGVGKLSIDGKKYDSTFISGLNAPKGMALIGDKLYVADIKDVVVIDVKKGKIDKKITHDSAQGFNDITQTDKGIIYVSDSRTGKVYRLENDALSIYLENMKGVNGLKAVGDDLYIASGKNFVKANAEKQVTPVAELPQGGDGVEPIGNGDFIVTAWSGYIFYVHADGKVDTLLETHQEKKNTADLGYDPDKKILYVPTFNGKTVVAYQLK